MFKKFFTHVSEMFNADVAMDLGTANTLVYVKNKGIILNEPSMVAISNNGQGQSRVEAVGAQAKKMHGRTHSRLQTIRPMKDCVIAYLDVTNKMIS